MKGNLKVHEPVLLKEVIEGLHIKNQGRYIDATLGAGNYTAEILKRGGQVFSLEADPEMIRVARNNIKEVVSFKKLEKNLKIIQGNFKDVEKLANQEGFNEVDGIVFDLGISNIHFGSAERGFSFRYEKALLDMRLNKISQAVMACDLLNALREDQLRDLFEITMPHKAAISLTREIILARGIKKFEKVADFLEVIEKAKMSRKKGINEATLPFLALRIAVNSELENLKEGLRGSFSLLKRNGVLLVVSFHSKEDEIVKKFFKEREQKSLGLVLTKKPIRPSQDEVGQNPKARSSLLRILRKI